MARKLGVESTDGCRFQAGVVAACLRERGVVHMDGVVNYDASKDVLQQQRLAFERDLAAERDPARTRAGGTDSDSAAAHPSEAAARCLWAEGGTICQASRAPYVASQSAPTTTG